MLVVKNGAIIDEECYAVLSEKILCRCKEKIGSNIRCCENFICGGCGYLPHKTM